MNDVTTLPLPPRAFWLLVTLLGIALISGFVFWLLKKAGEEPIKLKPMELLEGFAWVLFPIWTLLICAVLWKLWQLALVPLPRDDAELRWLALTLVGLITALGGLVGAPLALIRVFTTERQTKAQEEGLITDRINNAVRNLGADKQASNGPNQTAIWVPNIEVRIGAILELERLARNNLEVHVQIMEILCAYIKENAKAEDAVPGPELISAQSEPFSTYRDNGNEIHLDETLASPHKRYEKYFKNWVRKLPKPRGDVQLALTVIGRRTKDQLLKEAQSISRSTTKPWLFDQPPPQLSEKGKSAPNFETFHKDMRSWKDKFNRHMGYRLDLAGINLQGMNLVGVNFQGANLSQSRLQGANFRSARLEFVHLERSHLECTSFISAKMSGATLEYCQMQGANFSSARLQGSFIVESNCQDACFRNTNLQGSVFIHTAAKRASFSDADLRYITVQQSNLSFAYFLCSNLSRARFFGSILQGANLAYCKLGYISFLSGSVLGAFFKQNDLVRYEFINRVRDDIFSDKGTQLMDAQLPPDHWSTEVLDYYSGQETDPFREAWRAWQDTIPKDKGGNFL